MHCLYSARCRLKENIKKAPIIPEEHPQPLGEREPTVPMRYAVEYRVVEVFAELHCSFCIAGGTGEFGLESLKYG